jgi:hypothetical protein
MIFIIIGQEKERYKDIVIICIRKSSGSFVIFQMTKRWTLQICRDQSALILLLRYNPCWYITLSMWTWHVHGLEATIKSSIRIDQDFSITKICFRFKGDVRAARAITFYFTWSTRAWDKHSLIMHVSRDLLCAKRVNTWERILWLPEFIEECRAFHVRYVEK